MIYPLSNEVGLGDGDETSLVQVNQRLRPPMRQDENMLQMKLRTDQGNESLSALISSY